MTDCEQRTDVVSRLSRPTTSSARRASPFSKPRMEYYKATHRYNPPNSAVSRIQMGQGNFQRPRSRNSDFNEDPDRMGIGQDDENKLIKRLSRTTISSRARSAIVIKNVKNKATQTGPTPNSEVEETSFKVMFPRPEYIK